MPLNSPQYGQSSRRPMMDKGLQIKKRLEELADTAYQRSIVTFTEFMDLEEQHVT